MTAEVTYTSGSVPTAANLNATESKTVAASNAAPTNAPEGRVWYDTNASHRLLKVYDGSAWWSLPMGEIAKGDIIGTGTGGLIVGTEVTINGSDLLFTAEDGERYEYACDFIFQGAASSTDELFTVTPQRWNGSSWVAVDKEYRIQVRTASEPQREQIRFVHSPAGGASGFRLRIQRYYGTHGAEVISGTDATVVHIGTATS